ncbi:hypothetical protein [Streptomyces sp. NPDC059916]|uniref:hypothetical protein n=1 Tax=Streptomyces sp. NPDC059916 TaxID=3347001 RepID=UPI0036799CEF
MSALTVEQRGDLAEAMLPVAANLVALVHGDGGPEDIQEVMAGLDATQKNALLIVLAGLVDPDQPISKALGWLEFTEDRDLTVPPWTEQTRVRDLAPEPEAIVDVIDLVAVERYVKGFGVEVTDEERLAAVRWFAQLGESYGDVDELRDLPAKSTENFVNRMKKRYLRDGRPWVAMPRVATATEFTPEQVRELRERYAAGGVTDLELAVGSGVARKTITNLLSGVSYRSAGGPIRQRRSFASTASRASKRGFNQAPVGVAAGFNQSRV